MIGPAPKRKWSVATLEPTLSAALQHLPLSPEFCEQAERMPPLSRRLLLLGEPPESVAAEDLITELCLPPHVRAAARRGLESAADAAVMTRDGVLPDEACAKLRAAVDAEQQARHDTVDGAPDHQLNMSRDRLDALIGSTAAAALWSLPRDWTAARLRDWAAAAAADPEAAATAAAAEEAAAAEAAARLLDSAAIFVRKYQPSERPWNPFHTDSSALTINLALSDSGARDGGELLACFDGQMRRLRRRAGEATMHASTLLHGVSAQREGERYSLLMTHYSLLITHYSARG